jgi:hypothetical protein
VKAFSLKKYATALMLMLLCISPMFGQMYVGAGYQLGYHVPIYDQSPPTDRLSPYAYVALRYRSSGRYPTMESLYGQVDYSIQVFYQNLGNDEVMGTAFGVLPDVRFRLKDWTYGRLSFGGGLGFGYTSKPFDKAFNPTNQALGTALNFYAQMHLDYTTYLSDNWMLSAELGIHHMSNSFFSYPNLGVNIPSAGIGLYYNLGLEEKKKQQEIGPDVIRKTNWRPFIRGVYGITEKGFDGPHFSVAGGSIGIYKKIDIHRIVMFGGEYLFDESSYFFLQRAKGEDSEEVRRLSRRWMLFTGHEYLFGHFSLVTEAGLYLTEQYNRQHIISTKVGLNFYPWNSLFKNKHQLAIGGFIRAYFLRADFFEINLSYRL